MEHHAPHPGAAFEGYYSKFDLPSGACLALVICKVKDAKSKPNALSLTYVPKDGSNVFQRELFVEKINMERICEESHAFILDIPGIGYVKWNNDSSTEYKLEHQEFSFHARTTSRTPWSKSTETPEGLLVKLPLPLHWHVQSLASECTFNLDISANALSSEDVSGDALVHQEKNWANAFPTAHMWVQATEGDRRFCCAGGEILGLKAFLLGYRSSDVNLDIRPPFAVRIASFRPFLSYSSNWDDRTFELSAQTFRRKITVKATAPKGTFFSLSPPFKEGHRENFLGQSFHASVEVKIYESGWFDSWRLLREDHFEKAGLEFGGAYYPPAGSKERFN